MGILQHEQWPLVRTYVKIKDYDRDGGHTHPRHWIDLHYPVSAAELQLLLALTMPCTACGQMMHPVRERKGGGLYFASSCDIRTSMRCSKTKKASQEYEAIVAAMAGYADPTTPMLW